MEPLKRDRVGKLEKLKEVKSLDCHFVVPFSRSLLPTPRPSLLLLSYHFLHPGPYSNSFKLPLCSAVSASELYLSAGTIILFYLGDMLAYLGRCQQLLDTPLRSAVSLATTQEHLHKEPAAIWGLPELDIELMLGHLTQHRSLSSVLSPMMCHTLGHVTVQRACFSWQELSCTVAS